MADISSRAWAAPPARIARRHFLRLLAAASAASALPSFAFAQQSRHMLRVGVSTDTLAGVNVNDARAAYRVLSQEIARGLHIAHTEILPEVFLPPEQMVRMIREVTVDIFAITAWEFAKAIDWIDQGYILVDSEVGEGLEYVVVVRKGGGIERLDQLRGKQINLHRHHLNVMLPQWLTLLLAEHNLPAPEHYFASQMVAEKLTQVVLPVFFGTTPAAALTRLALNTAVELNPQLGRELQVLAVSPRVIPVIFCNRRGANPDDVREFRGAVARLHTIPAGQQVLQLYQTRGWTERQGNCMNPTLEFIRRYEHMKAHPPAGMKG